MQLSRDLASPRTRSGFAGFCISSSPSSSVARLLLHNQECWESTGRVNSNSSRSLARRLIRKRRGYISLAGTLLLDLVDASQRETANIERIRVPVTPIAFLVSHTLCRVATTGEWSSRHQFVRGKGVVNEL
jgi:hypothetical protein